MGEWTTTEPTGVEYVAEVSTGEHGKSGSSWSYTVMTTFHIGRRKSDGAVVVKAVLFGKRPGNWSTQDAEAIWSARRSTESTTVDYYKYLSGYISTTSFKQIWVAYYIDETKQAQKYILKFDKDAYTETESLSIEAYGDIFYIKVDGSWKQATPWVKVNGTWKQAVGRIKINGSWV